MKRLTTNCPSACLTYLSTPFSREAADHLQSIGVAAFKIGSGECNNYPLLDHIAKNPDFIRPTQYRNEIVSFLEKEGLRDLSISRTSFAWGIPAP